MKVTGAPEQIEVDDATTDTEGIKVFTVTVPDPVPEHPASVYVTVYVVVEAGLTVILAVVAPPGDHE